MSGDATDKRVCEHCRGAHYVFSYWLEKLFEREGIHLIDIPPDVFRMIPVQHLQFCHCNTGVVHFGRNRYSNCMECDGTTWLFSEIGKQAGYRWKKVLDLAPTEVRELPSEYFERCSCDSSRQNKKRSRKDAVLEGIADLLRPDRSVWPVTYTPSYG